MGNSAAHERTVHSEAQLIAGFEVLEHMLKGLYIIPGHAAALPAHWVTAIIASASPTGSVEIQQELLLAAIHSTVHGDWLGPNAACPRQHH